MTQRTTVLTVSQVNAYIKSLINEVPQIRNVYISGEISNFKHYYKSGHMYFTLKDEKSQLKCVMFSFDNSRLRFEPEEGMQVICFGQIDVYERDGVYQLYVRDMHPKGVGSLTLAFEQLKEKLQKEGLFSTEHKKPIPKYPQKIGVATSNMGAAVEDIKNVITRRWPLCEIIISPTVVQGDAAAPDIVRSIAYLDSLGLDTIIVGRGGGSLEDLWAFNTEAVARAVYNCKTPIISAVGHETDFTICDFVSDLRAPTPSAAAELAVPDVKNELIKIGNLSASIEQSVNFKIEKEERRVSSIIESKALSKPLEKRLELETRRLEMIMKQSPLADTNAFFDTLFGSINELSEKMNERYKNIVTGKENELKQLSGQLNALSPLAVLSRGYSIVSKDEKVIKSKKNVSVGDELNILLSDGKIKAKVSENE